MTYYILSDERGDRFGTIEDGEGFEDRVKEALSYCFDEIEYKDKIEANTSFTACLNGEMDRDFYLEATCIFPREVTPC